MKHIHLIGIGGSGLSAIARILIENGYKVTGSDQNMSAMAETVIHLGAQVFTGHSAENIFGADTVIYSSAISADNPELVAAKNANIPVFKRSEFIGRLFEGKKCLAIAGTHGKTTTTAMLAWILSALDQDPSYIIGGISKNLGNNAHAGKGEYFVIEADEYDRMFHGLKPEYMVITNVEHDHPDCYPTLASYHQSFAEFIQKLSPTGVLFACKDDDPAYELSIKSSPASGNIFSYGLDKTANYTALNLEPNDNGGFRFDFAQNTTDTTSIILKNIDLSVPGKHNVQNAVAVLAIIHQLGLPFNKTIEHFKEFKGTGRRFEKLGEVKNILIIDDYGHHPTEIEATLSAASACYPGRRIWAVWQPHTYSRTQSLESRFISSLKLADKVIITEVFAARESNNGFSSQEIVNKMNDPDVTFAPKLEAAEQYLLANIQQNDIVIVLSAGDANQISANIYKHLQEQVRDE